MQTMRDPTLPPTCRLTRLGLALVLTACVAACGGGSDSSSAGTSSSSGGSAGTTAATGSGSGSASGGSSSSGSSSSGSGGSSSGSGTATGGAAASPATVGLRTSTTDASVKSTPSRVGTLSVAAGADVSLALPDTVARLDGQLQGAASWVWTQDSGPHHTYIESARSASTRINLLKAGDYVFRLTGTASSGEVASDTVRVSVAANPVVLGSQSTPLDHIRSRPRPVFASAHGLPPLTHSHCGLHNQIDIELARHWGFALQFPQYGSSKREPASYWTGNDMGNTADLQKEIRANPGRYKISAGNGSLYDIFNNHLGTRKDLPQLAASTWLRNSKGEFLLDGGRPIVSPIASDEDMVKVGTFVGNALPGLVEAIGQKIDVYLNGGEYGLAFPGDNDYASYFGRDPAVKSSYEASGKGSWANYISFHKARQERLIKQGILSGLTQKPQYALYGEAYGMDRGRWAGWSWHNFLYEEFLDASGSPLVSEYAAPEMYYHHHNSGWTGIHDGSVLPWDAFTQALNNVAGGIHLGQRHFYPFVSMGWEGYEGQPIASAESYLGALKMYYLAGAIGTASGYFVCDGPHYTAMAKNEVVGLSVPTQVKQLIAEGQAQALFSHLASEVRNSDLLPGTAQHPYQSYTTVLPAMELEIEGETRQLKNSSGTAGTVRTARALARKLKNGSTWLVGVWANTGNARNVKVKLGSPVGTLELNAAVEGAVYRVTWKDKTATIVRLDPEPGLPTAAMFP